jgi:predicted MPP superfamily phosphohydrolase
MTLDRLVLVPLALGHLALFVLAMNVTHGLGYREVTMRRTKLTLLALFGASSALLAWEVVRGSVAAWSWPTLLYASLCGATGLVFVPLFTAYLHLRPRPEGIAGRTTEVDLAATAGKDALIGGGRHAWMLRLPGNESLRLRKVEWDVTVAGLPEALDGLSLLHLSDLHFARCFERRYFEGVIDEAASMESDLVLLTGDIVDDDGCLDWIEPLLCRLKGRLGTFAILGNHDEEHQPGRILRLLEDAGFTTLEGRWATVESGGTTIVLGGTSAPWGPEPPLEDRPAGDFSVLLSHVPDQFYWAERAGFDLMLSGHNHGGQVRLPLIGSVFMPSRYSRRFDRGFFRRRGLTLHVSQGIAGQHPIRYGCVPEVGRLIVRAGAPAPRASQNAHPGRRHPGWEDMTLSGDRLA